MTKKKEVKKEEVVAEVVEQPVEEVVEVEPVVEVDIEEAEKPTTEEIAEPFGGGPFQQD